MSFNKYVNHVGYFPFCIGYKNEFNVFQTTSSSPQFPIFPALLKVPLKDAMALYWKAYKARLKVSFSYAGAIDVNTPVTVSVDVDTELNFYENILQRPDFSGGNFVLTGNDAEIQARKKDNANARVCFDSGNPNDSEDIPKTFISHASNASVGIFSCYAVFFPDFIHTQYAAFGPVIPIGANFQPIERIFLKQEKPITPPIITGDTEVYVTMYFSANVTGIYTSYFALNYPHAAIIDGFPAPSPSILEITINQRKYSVQLINVTFITPSKPSPNYELEITTEP